MLFSNFFFTDIFKVGLKDIWRQHGLKNETAEIPSETEMFSCVELVLTQDESKVIERKRYPGENTIAMVAWKMTFRTPGE